MTMSRIRELGGIAKPCPECTAKRRNPKIKPICDYCNSTGLVSLMDYERWFSKEYDRPINLKDVRISDRIKELNNGKPSFKINVKK